MGHNGTDAAAFLCGRDCNQCAHHERGPASFDSSALHVSRAWCFSRSEMRNLLWTHHSYYKLVSVQTFPAFNSVSLICPRAF